MSADFHIFRNRIGEARSQFDNDVYWGTNAYFINKWIVQKLNIGIIEDFEFYPIPAEYIIELFNMCEAIVNGEVNPKMVIKDGWDDIKYQEFMYEVKCYHHYVSRYIDSVVNDKEYEYKYWISY